MRRKRITGDRPRGRNKEVSDISRLRNTVIGVVALVLGGALVALTGAVLTGSLRAGAVTAVADFTNCGQGLREGGDVKLRGVLVGTIGRIKRHAAGRCLVQLRLVPEDVEMIPADVGAQIRAKTVFGEKWVELVYPRSPGRERIAAGDVIPPERTIDPLEVETILNVALPLLEAIDPEALAGILQTLADGFVGHEDAAIRSINSGIDALEPLNRDRKLLVTALRQLTESSDVLDEVSPDLLEAMDNLTSSNRFITANRELIAESLERAPVLLDELHTLFDTRFDDLTKLVDSGATVIGLLAARTDDIDRLLELLPQFGSAWIRNMRPTCVHRQINDEDLVSVGDPVPGRCWRVHDVLSQSRGPYGPGQGPQHGGSPPPDSDEATGDLERVLGGGTR